MINFPSCIQWDLPQMKKATWWFIYSSFRVFVSLEQLAGKRVPIHQIMGKRTLKGTRAFNCIFNLMISHSYPKFMWGWSYICFSVFEALQKFGKSVLISIDAFIFIFSTFSFELLFHDRVNEPFLWNGSQDIGK